MFTEFYIWFKLLHIVAALAFFGLEGAYPLHKAALGRAADFAALKKALSRFEALVKLIGTAALVILISGLLLVFMAWGWQTAWVNLGLGLFVLNIVVTSLFDMPWSKALRKAVEGRSGALTAEVRSVEADPRMHFSHTLKTAIDFALVFLMTIKPDLWLALSGSSLIVAAYFAYATLSHGSKRPDSTQLVRDLK